METRALSGSLKTPPGAEVVICGAGIAGIAVAHELTVNRAVGDVVLVDERAPLSLTSDKSTECYRNWWPGPDDAMVALMNRSIDLLEEQARRGANAIRLNRRGYLYATAQPGQVSELVRLAERSAALGAGPLRTHGTASSDYLPAPAAGFEAQPDGADLVLEPDLIRRHFPYLAGDTVAVLHARRCGWFSGHGLGLQLLEQARAAGLRFLPGRVTAVATAGGRVCQVTVEGRAGRQVLATPCFVNAAGPLVNDVATLLGLTLPVYHERHAKLSFADRRGALPREAPLVIWADPIRLPWSDEERRLLEAAPEQRHLAGILPAGVHGRPEGAGGSQAVLLLWAYDAHPVHPALPPRFDPAFPEIVLRGMARAVPAFGAYLQPLPRGFVDGGYYTRTRENRLLAGPLPIAGAHVLGALSGHGLMAALGAAELVAAGITGGSLPAYAAAFRPDRYQDPSYLAALDTWGETGQL